MENHRSGPEVDMPVEGDADGDVVGGKGVTAARLRGKK